MGVLSCPSLKVFVFSSLMITHYYSQREDVIMEATDELIDDVVERQLLLSSRSIYFSICLKSITITIAAAESSLFTATEWFAIWAIPVQGQVQ